MSVKYKLLKFHAASFRTEPVEMGEPFTLDDVRATANIIMKEFGTLDGEDPTLLIDNKPVSKLTYLDICMAIKARQSVGMLDQWSNGLWFEYKAI